MEGFLINMALSILFSVVKNPGHVSSMKAALRKLRDILLSLPLD